MKKKYERRHIQVKRAWAKEGKPQSLKRWARTQPIGSAPATWLVEK